MRRLTVLLLAACGALAAVPSNASAAVTCSLAANVLTVDVTGTSDQTAGLRLEGGGVIGVWNTTDFSAGQQVCAGGPPTTVNTNSINVTDTDPGVQRTLLKVSLAGGPFINLDPTGEGTGKMEIEIT